MILFKRSDDLRNWLNRAVADDRTIGFVPTMGALHAGHISLITISKKTTDLTVCSIFVNPTQFNDQKDFQKYPVNIENDIALLVQAGVDVLFLPSVAELYPGGTSGLEHYDLGRLEALLEGKYRPGHFQGVCQVMFRLLGIVKPDRLFMGQKDYQQCLVIERLLAMMQLPTKFERCPIMREADGLAMSSRNVRLDPTQRSNATAIYRALLLLKDEWRRSGDEAQQAADSILKQADFRLDYISIADGLTLEPVSDPNCGPAVALIAAFQGEVRLIDNMML